jgi:hypothetical protein
MEKSNTYWHVQNTGTCWIILFGYLHFLNDPEGQIIHGVGPGWQSNKSMLYFWIEVVIFEQQGS